MHRGRVSSIRNNIAPGRYIPDGDGSLGNYVTVTSVINGRTVHLKYNHLNSVNVREGQHISAGTVMDCQEIQEMQQLLA